MSEEQQESGGAEPIGWDAIDATLAPIYGDREPHHYAAVVPAFLGGNDPLQGISIYHNLTPAPHWHYVTYGFSELYEKESDDPAVSGYGFELTFRLACAAETQAEPPAWPLDFLQNLARYVFSSGNALDERHHLTLNGPIALDEGTEITAIAMILDPQLKEIDTRNGHVKFLQIIGLCEDEYSLLQEGYFEPVISRVMRLLPLAITDIHRGSILKDPATLQEITSAEPEVKQAEVYGTIGQWSDDSGRLELTLGATIIPQVRAMLRGRLAKGEHFAVYGKQTGMVFESGDANGWRVDESVLIISLTQAAAKSLGEKLQPIRGDYQTADFPALIMHVEKVDIKDQDGNVAKTVG